MKVHYQFNADGTDFWLVLPAVLTALLLLPLLVFAAADDAVLQSGTEITANSVTVTVKGSAVESLTVNDGNFTVDMVDGSSMEITAADKNKFTVSPSTRQESFTCGSSESVLLLTGPPAGSATETVTVTPSSDTCSTGGGGGTVGGGSSSPSSGGGGGGASVTVPAAVTAAPAASVAQPSAVASAVSPVFTGKLTRGISSSDVKRLQQLLNSDPDTRVAVSGVGSSGNETNFYGSLTEAAVKKFQAKYGVVSSGTPETTGYGLVGPKTRAKLQEVFGSGATPTTPATPSGTATQEAALQQQISDLLKLVEELQKQIQALLTQ